MDYILRIITDNWKMKLAEALKNILRKEIDALFRHHRLSQVEVFTKYFILQLRDEGMSPGDVLDSFKDAILILKFLPRRFYIGAHYFKDDFLNQFELQSDQKQKTIFSMKVLCAMLTYFFSTIHSLRKGKINFFIPGLRSRSAVTNLIAAEFIFRLGYLILKRLLAEIEKSISDQEDLKHVQYFRELLENSLERNESEVTSGEHSIAIVEAFRTFILTGKRI